VVATPIVVSLARKKPRSRSGAGLFCQLFVIIAPLTCRSRCDILNIQPNEKGGLCHELEGIMDRQDQEQSRRWRDVAMRCRHLALPFLLAILAVLGLLYLLSPGTTVEPGVSSLKQFLRGEEIRAVAYNSRATLWSGSPLIKGESSTGNCANLSGPLCRRCEISVGGPTTQTVLPEGSVQYELSIANTGYCAGVFTLASTSQQGWGVSGIPSSPLSLPKNKSTSVILTHTAPTTCELKSLAGVATITAVLDCMSCGSPDKKTLSFTTTVEKKSGVDLSPDITKIAAPGDVVLFTHTLTNTGNYTDTITFVVEQTKNWPTFTSPPPTTLGLCGFITVTLPVTVSQAASPSEVNVITLTAASSEDTDYVIDRVQVVTPVCGLRLGVTPTLPFQLAVPGSAVPYTLTVGNCGEYTGQVTLNVHSSAGWNVIAPTTPITLFPQQDDVWVVSPVVPSCEKVLTNTTRVTATLTCTMSNRTETDVRTASLTTTVVSAPVARIEPDYIRTVPVTESVSLWYYKVITFPHTVTNIGNQLDTFDFYVHSAQDWDVIRHPLSYTLDQCETQTVVISVTVQPGEPVLSETVVITAVPQSAQDRYDTATDRIRDGRAFLPIVAKNFCEGMPLCNGDFETGDLSCWRGGGVLTVSIAPGLSGYWSALLGSPNFQCWQGVPVGKAWLEQTFSVPNYGSPQLSFRYKMHTQHAIKHDTFDVYLNGYRILRKGQTGEKTGCVKPGKEKVIAGTCTIDLANPTDCDGNPIAADFACANVTLRFENWNRDLIYYNTWTYVDDVKFTW
jgi:hypothetical protein